MPDEVVTLFHHPTTAATGIDPGALVAGGRRSHRRPSRRLLAGAAMLVLCVGAWTALQASTVDETLTAVTPPTSRSLPEPIVELFLGVIPQTDRTMPLVAAVGEHDSPDRLVFSLRTEDGDVVASRQVHRRMGEKPRWATLIPGVTVAMLPSRSTGAVPVWHVRQSAAGTMVTRMPDGHHFIAWWTDGRSRTSFTDVIWTDGTSVHTAHAESLSSVVVDEHVFFAGGAGRLVGFFTPPVGSASIRHGEATAARHVDEEASPAVWAEHAGAAGGTYATYLPPVRDVALVTGDVARVRDLTVHDLPDETGVLVTARVDGDGTSVTEVRYTDPGGRPTAAPASAL